jgi:pimeloyl-ACP methyl ester carboxylesterase
MPGPGPRVIQANGVDLCVETFGGSADPAILLIAGIAMSMDWWDEDLCERLAAGSRYVIRYDLRDTGQSVTYEPGAPEYTGRDLVEDVIGLLDALGVSRAHVVGLSMGGGLAQLLVLEHPARVASLTLMSTSSGGNGLPSVSAQLAAHFANPPPEPDWSDRDAVVEYILEDLRAYAGRFPFDEDGLRTRVGRIVDRSSNIASTMTNHSLISGGGDPLRPRLGEITAPTLVLHGTEDPLFPLAHGEALAAEIPGARLVPLEGVGHEMPPRQVWDQVVAEILEHTDER